MAFTEPVAAPAKDVKKQDKAERHSIYRASTFHKRNDRALLTWSNLNCHVPPPGAAAAAKKRGAKAKAFDDEDSQIPLIN